MVSIHSISSSPTVSSVSNTSALQNIATGNRINSAADDAAGLAISQKALSQEYNNLRVSEENQQAMRSRISDADIAKESIRLAQEKMMQNIQFSMQAMCMQNAANVLHLLR